MILSLMKSLQWHQLSPNKTSILKLYSNSTILVAGTTRLLVYSRNLFVDFEIHKTLLTILSLLTLESVNGPMAFSQGDKKWTLWNASTQYWRSSHWNFTRKIRRTESGTSPLSWWLQVKHNLHCNPLHSTASRNLMNIKKILKIISQH